MFKRLRLSFKIFFGFLLVLFFLCVVSVMGIRGFSSITSRVQKADGVNRIVKMLLETRQQEKNYILRQDADYSEKVFKGIQAIVAQAESLKGLFSQKVNLDQMDRVITGVGEYENAFKIYVGGNKDRSAAMAEMRSRAGAALAQLEEIRKSQKQKLLLAMEENKGAEAIVDRIEKADDTNRIIKWFITVRKYEKEYIISRDPKWMENIRGDLGKIYGQANDLKQRFRDQDNIAQVSRLIEAVEAYDAGVTRFAQLMKEQAAADKNMVEAARKVLDECAAARADQKAKMERDISTDRSLMLVGSVVAVIVGMLFAFLITRAVTRPLNDIIQGLNEGALQMTAASGQVSTSSQSLAEGASEQAAAIEETSSSMEEMAAMTKKNSENASAADGLMKKSNQVVTEANASMAELTRSMVDISKASEETSKIIKTIDEIAFQTNLLALNAAVEAARAGEAGAGFAVVADEVRNLAMRAAEAAKSTAELIQGTVKKVKDGSDLVSSTNEAFSQVTESSVRVGGLVSEISEASQEQATGIDQVNRAVSEMDKVVQQNAANAEESASAAEEMSAQAEQLKVYVDNLVAMVTGTTAGHGLGSAYTAPSKALGTRQRKKAIPHSAREIRPDQMIPFDDADEDFKSF